VRTGVVFPQTEIGPRPADVRRYVETAERLEHAGREPKLWGPYTERDPFHEPFVLFGYLAALTTTSELDTAIIILPQRQTALAAKQAAEVDLWSGGRLRLGLGVGWNPFEFDALDQDFTRRGRRMDAQIAAMRTLWSAKVVDVTIGDEVIRGGGLDPLPERQIPIWIGGRSAAAYRRAVTLGQGWLSNFQDHLANDREAFVAAKAELVAAAGGSLPDGFGIESWTSPGRTSPDGWAAEVDGWAELGVTHLSLRTDESRRDQPVRPSSVDLHIDLMARYAEAVGLTGAH